MSTDTHSLPKLQEAFKSIPAGPPCGDCPDPDRLWAAVRLKLPAEERREIVRHTAVCAACAEDWRVSWALWKKEQESDSNGSGGEVLNGPWRTFKKSFKKSLPQVAAAGLVFFAVGFMLFHQAPNPTFRGNRHAVAQLQSHNLDGASLPRDNFLLHWTPSKGASYKLHLMRKNGDALKTISGLTSAEFLVPESVLEGIDSGEQVLWRVEIRHPVEGLTPLRTFTTYVK